MEWLKKYLQESGQSLLEGGQHIVRALGDVTPFSAQMAGEPVAPPNPELKGLASGLLDAPMAVGAPLAPKLRAPTTPAMTTPKGWEYAEPGPHRKTAASPASDHIDLLGPRSPEIEEVVGWPYGPHPQRRMAVPEGQIAVGKPNSAMRPEDPDHGLTMAEMEALAKRFGFDWDLSLKPDEAQGQFWPMRALSMGKAAPGGIGEAKEGAIKLRPEYKDNVQRSLVTAHELSHGIDWKAVPGVGYGSSPAMHGSGSKTSPNIQNWRDQHTNRPNWEVEYAELQQAGSLTRHGGHPYTRATATYDAANIKQQAPEGLHRYGENLKGGFLGEPTKEVYADALALYLTDPKFMKENFPNAAQFFRETMNRSDVGKWLQLNSVAPLAAAPALTELLTSDEPMTQDPELQEIME